MKKIVESFENFTKKRRKNIHENASAWNNPDDLPQQINRMFDDIGGKPYTMTQSWPFDVFNELHSTVLDFQEEDNYTDLINKIKKDWHLNISNISLDFSDGNIDFSITGAYRDLYDWFWAFECATAELTGLALDDLDPLSWMISFNNELTKI